MGEIPPRAIKKKGAIGILEYDSIYKTKRDLNRSVGVPHYIMVMIVVAIISFTLLFAIISHNNYYNC